MLTITPNRPSDWNGYPRIEEGQEIQWRIESSDPSLNESVLITPNTPNVITAEQTVNFVAGGDRVQFRTFATADDKVYEPNDWYSFSFAPINNAVLNTSFYSGPLINNDSLPVVAINAQEATILENAADRVFRFVVERVGDDLSVVTNVEVRIGPTGTTPTDQADLATQFGTQVVRFAPNETSKAIEVRFNNDTAVEAAETFEAQITSATSTSPTQFWSDTQYNPVNKYSATVAILNDDPNSLSVKPDDPDPAPIPVHRFYNAVTNAHFFTASAAERDIIQNTLPDYRYEGVGFQAVPEQEGADPLYRFFNTQTNTHFFTPSAAERDSVIANLSSIYNYEGIGFYASDKDGGGLTEVYRFYNTATGVHFYTPSVLERNTVQQTLPTYSYEGVGFYVPDSPSYDLLG
ncbi:Calx-beta domain-containing protein [Belnapia rosea]|uniref:Calx-beta domain-containing protein n=1 Tax=Belnapia rosea TaxID=938405 RepID=A0A1G7ESY0_9PROT|nr:Calx-beta domain-containing protein [Belnapia rosea]SDE66770.1 Calx-beta domain-containing protein [Belnapia rosea]